MSSDLGDILGTDTFAPPANPALPEMVLRNKIESEINAVVRDEDAKIRPESGAEPFQKVVQADPQAAHKKQFYEEPRFCVAVLVLLVVVLNWA